MFDLQALFKLNLELVEEKKENKENQNEHGRINENQRQ